MDTQGQNVPTALGDPPFLAVFGAPGIGKTLDQSLTYPTAYTMCLPGALRGGRQVMGDALYAAMLERTARVTSLDDVLAFVYAVQRGDYPPLPIRIDDVTVLGAATIQRLYTQYGGNNMKVYGEYGRMVQNLRTVVRALGVPCAMTLHTRPPGTDDLGRTVPGGIEVGGKQGKARLEGVLDAIYGAVRDPEAWPHPARYKCVPGDHTMVYKDRDNGVIGLAPMNLREILRQTGHAPARAPGLEWLDEVADQVAAAVTAGKPPKTVFAESMQALLDQGVYRGHAYWGVRDGLARAELAATGDVFDYFMAQAAAGDVAPPAESLANKLGG